MVDKGEAPNLLTITQFSVTRRVFFTKGEPNVTKKRGITPLMCSKVKNIGARYVSFLFDFPNFRNSKCMKCILGTKLGMTQVFDANGTVIPVTRVQAGPCTVTQVKTVEKDGVSAVQIGYGTTPLFRMNQPKQGHVRGLAHVRFLRDFRIAEDHALTRGGTFGASIFAPGDVVQVVGTSKGRGFQGVVKRHGFKGAPKTHGHKHDLRAPGSIGAGGVQRVFKDMRMAGHMGDARVTVKNLTVVEVHPETNELYIKGALPGSRGGLVLISTQNGSFEVESMVQEKEAPATPVVAEEVPVAVNA